MKFRMFLLLPVILCLTSCATVFNRKEYAVNLTGTKENMKVIVNDSTYILPAAVKVKRSKADLPITVISDSVTKQAVIEAGISPTYVYANIWLLEFSPILYGADLFSQKRFYYGRDLTLDDTTSVYKPSVFNPYKRYFGTKFCGEKGQWNIVLGMPYGNIFYMQPRNSGIKKGGGFFGFEVGAEYYYNPRRFLKFTASAAIDFLAPVPAAVTYDGDYESMKARNFTFTDNFIIARNTIGYGLNYGIYSWQRHSPDYGTDVTAPPPSKKDSHALGLNLTLHHQLTRYMAFGASYNPAIYSIFPKAEFLYQHVISIEFVYKIPINRPTVPWGE